jgi:hypothetical protein
VCVYTCYKNNCEGNKNIPEGKRSIGKPRRRWLINVESYLKKMGVRGWRIIARDRDASKLKETKVLHGA